MAKHKIPGHGSQIKHPVLNQPASSLGCNPNDIPNYAPAMGFVHMNDNPKDSAATEIKERRAGIPT